MKKNSIVNKKIFWIRAVVTVCTIVAILCSVVRCAFLVRDSLEGQIPLLLQDIAEQNAKIIETEIKSKQDVLNSIARDIEYFGKDEKDLILSFLDSYVELYDFKRMGMITPSKMAYTTDGYVQQLPDEAYINSVFRGQTEVSDVLMDVLGEEEAINVLAVPVYKLGTQEVDYILFGTYQTLEFRKLLNVEFYDEEGYTLIVKTDGTLVTGPDIIPVDKKNNLFAELIEYEEVNEEIIKNVQQKMKSGECGNGQIEYNGGKYFYYMPLEVEADNSSWYMIAVAPEEVLTARVDEVWNHVLRMVLMVAVVGVLFGVIYLYTHYSQKKRLLRLAYVDHLTGSDNLACFKDKLKGMKETDGYMVSMDMGEFRLVNSICGVVQADKLLIRISKILQSNITENELMAHMNADNFVMFLQADNKEVLEGRILGIAQQITNLIAELNVPRIVPYFGVVAAKSTDGFVKVHSYAKQAKLSVKGKKKAILSFYDEMDLQQHIENKKLEDRFEAAIIEHEFEVWYQPKFDTQQGMIVGAEALVRWRKDGVLIPPGKFIPLFEKNGMIETLDEYVFREVCRQQKQWQEEGKKLFPVSVNISRASLYYADIAAKYRAIADEYKIPLELVQIEITESATINNGEICTLINEFHKEGFCILLDDFGNGYSSLSTLNVMHFDVLKLDKGLIDYIGDVNGEVLLYHIIKLAQSLGLKITAEGVEYKEQVEYLKKMKCDDIQGYYFSKPLPVHEFEILLKAS